jgi:RNA polymerase sigma-70 factor (ECF subfamily)
MQQDQRLALMQQALDELSAACRDCFLLRKIEGLSHPQIAERWASPAAWWRSTSSMP